jgi:hypothetical protein
LDDTVAADLSQPGGLSSRRVIRGEVGVLTVTVGLCLLALVLVVL